MQSLLVHPNIVTLHTFFHEGGKYCIVMELAEGGTLKQLIEQEGAIPGARALSIFRQVLKAVGYAHAKNIIHRDIKPSNIMVGSDDRVKVMDFGIAKIMGERGLTSTGVKVGTLWYMSPEQVKAAKNIDQRTDIFSLGVTLYETLTGRLPFEADTESDFEIMDAIVNQEFIPISRWLSGVKQNVSDAIRIATDKSRENRFETCAEFEEALFGGTSESKGHQAQLRPEHPPVRMSEPGLRPTGGPNTSRPPAVPPGFGLAVEKEICPFCKELSIKFNKICEVCGCMKR